MMMSFDPATLLTVAATALIMFAIAMLLMGGTARSDRRWWVAAFLLGAVGFVLMIASPENPVSWPRDGANISFMLAYGCCHAGARGLTGRRPVFLVIVGGAIVWLALARGLHIPSAFRVTFASVLVCSYATLIAAEFLRGAAPQEKARRFAGYLCFVHACFFAVRAALGPTLGLADSSAQSALSTWAAILAFETILFTAVLAMLIVAALRDKEILADRALALTDSLTGVGNRRAFENQAPRLLEIENIRETRPILLMIDLDGFKAVNDREGHAAGDRLLVEVANAVRLCLSDPGMFWRIGGDEFVALLCGPAAARAPLVAEAIRAAVKKASRESHGGSATSATIGLVTVREGVTLAELLDEADAALYAGKQRGRDCAVIAEIRRVEPLSSSPGSWRGRFSVVNG
jgi:diguanylate cyclase (GGDEF)-like protein